MKLAVNKQKTLQEINHPGWCGSQMAVIWNYTGASNQFQQYQETVALEGIDSTTLFHKMAIL